MKCQDQGECGVDDSENGEGYSECSERSPSVTDEASGDSSEKSASIQKYEEEWEHIFCHNDPDFGELKRRAVTGNLRASRFRSVCWRALLGVFSTDKDNWLEELRQFRQHYHSLTQEFFVEPWTDNDPKDNPLAQNTGSLWNQHFCDSDLKSVIRQDVVRTFPGVDFFRKERVQQAMLNVLFVYARENPEMCYRQGMHEILAPLLFVLHCDHQALLHTKEQVIVSESIAEMLDPNFLEADSYSMFCLIMEAISCYYRVNDSVPTASGYFPPNLQSPGQSVGNNRKENEILIQLEAIKENLLVPTDKELADYLKQLEITLPVFGIRWLRLLFGREFPLQDLLVLWDAIFAESKNFGLVHYIMVAMLVAIRNQLLNSDYSTCLMHLMRYPGAVDITYIIEHALYLKDPQTYSKPAITSFLPVLPVSKHRPQHTKHVKLHPRQAYVHSSSRGDKRHERKILSSGSSLSDRFKKLSTRHTQWNSGKVPKVSSGHLEEPSSSHAALGTGTPSASGHIVEGVTLNERSSASELEYAHAVMTLCHLKLTQYHNTLSRIIDIKQHPEAQLVLDGLSELCGLLKNRTYRSRPPEIEPAYEAGEVRVEPPVHVPAQISAPQSPPFRRSAIPPSHLVLPTASEKIRKKEIGRSHGGKPSSTLNVPLKTFSESAGVVGANSGIYPLEDPLKTIKSVDSENTEHTKDHAAFFVKF